MTAPSEVTTPGGAFMERVMADLSAAMTGVLCGIGVRLGLFAALSACEPATPAELAEAAGADERYVREWLYGLTAAGYLSADRGERRFRMADGLAPLVAGGSPLDLSGGYRLIPALAAAADPVVEAFRTGAGIPADRYGPELYQAMEQMSASWLDTMFVPYWIPAVEGLAERLRRGGRIADVGCGGGRAMVVAAGAYPEARCVGFDAYGPNVARAREAAADAGVADRVRFVQADAADALEGRYDLVTAFDVLHDAPDPARLLRRIREVTAPDGVFLLLESRSAEDPLDNTGPVAATLYATSVLYCLPAARAEGGAGLGTLGLPEPAVRRLAAEAGFGSVTPVPNPNPFNALYAIRP